LINNIDQPQIDIELFATLGRTAFRMQLIVIAMSR
jgi:hypothetical protein